MKMEVRIPESTLRVFFDLEAFNQIEIHDVFLVRF